MKILLKWFDGLINLAFPERKDYVVVKAITDEEVLNCYCRDEHKAIIYLSSFKDPRIRALVHEAKFHENERAFWLLGLLVKKFLDTRASEVTIFPIPLSKEREKTRGHNQVTSILKTLPNIKIDTSTLYRTRHTVPQTSLAKNERAKNLEGAFAVRKGAEKLIYQKEIIIFDDVTTTGATLRTAKDALLSHQPQSLTLVAIAH